MALYTVRYRVTFETTVTASTLADAAFRAYELSRDKPTTVLAVWPADEISPALGTVAWLARMGRRKKKR